MFDHSTAHERIGILFFDGLIDQFAQAQNSVAKTLQTLGYEVEGLICKGAVSRCPFLSNVPTDISAEARNNICNQCHQKTVSLAQTWKLPTSSVLDYLTPIDIRRIQLSIPHTPEELKDFEVEGNKIGFFAAHDIILRTKADSVSYLSDIETYEFRQLVETGAITYFAAKRWIQTRGLSHVITYNNYSTCVGVQFAAKTCGITAMTNVNGPHSMVDLSRMILSKGYRLDFRRQMNDMWRDAEDIPLSQMEVADTYDDLLTRFGRKTNFTYSPQFTGNSSKLEEELSIDSGSTNIVLFTSSLDERFGLDYIASATDHSLGCVDTFPSQIEWIESVIQWSQNFPNINVIVRVHPREDANHRDSSKSSHLNLLEQRFKNTPSNTRIIWPQSSISTYDLMGLATVALVSWSSVGHEAARLGIPTMITTSKAGPYTGEEILHPTDPADYFQELERMIASEPSTRDVVNAWRWYHFYHVKPTLDIPTVNHPSKVVHTDNLAHEIDQLMKHDTPVVSTKLSEFRRQGRDRIEELSALRAAFYRLLFYFCVGTEIKHSIDLPIIDVTRGQTPTKNGRGYFLLEEGAVTFNMKPHTLSARHQLALRCARLIQKFTEELQEAVPTSPIGIAKFDSTHITD